MTLLLNAFMPFASRGVHPSVPGTSMDFSPAQQTAMASIDASVATVGFSGTTNAGVVEWRMSAGATLSIPAGEVLTKLTVEVVARVASPVTYTTDPVWGVELFDSRTNATLGAVGKQATIPISGSLVTCSTGGQDLWGLTQAKLLDALSAGALRVRWTSPGWANTSTGSLIIDGSRVTVESGPPPASKRQTILTRRTATPGRVPQPSELDAGELCVNLAEGRLYVGAGSFTMGINAVPFWWSGAAYQAGYVTMYANRLWVANTTTGPGPRNAAHWTEYHAASAQSANLLLGWNLDQIYNLVHPWWTPRLWRGSQADLINENNGLAAAGISARWWIADGAAGRPNAIDLVVRGARVDAEVNATGGSWTALTDLRGSHDHSGSTFGTALTIGQMPSHNHNSGVFSQLLRTDTANIASNDGVTSGAGTNIRNSATIVAQGNNEQHFHGIGLVGDHQHAVALEVAHIRWWWLVRTA